MHMSFDKAEICEKKSQWESLLGMLNAERGFSWVGGQCGRDQIQVCSDSLFCLTS
jgi:hypothetical protein